MEDAIKLKRQLRRTRVVLVIFITLSFLFFVYAYVQKLEADKQAIVASEFRIIAEKWMKETVQQKEMAEQAKAEAERQKMIAISSQAEALQALDDCKKKKQ